MKGELRLGPYKNSRLVAVYYPARRSVESGRQRRSFVFHENSSLMLAVQFSAGFPLSV